MQDNHTFIFLPGVWKGTGKISFNVNPEEIKFSTEWTINEAIDNTIHCSQKVLMENMDESVCNKFTVSKIVPESFQILLENHSEEKIPGTGIFDSEKIAWEFRNMDGFEGFEIYEKDGENKYNFHAEYITADKFRTVIDGSIEKK